MAMKPALTGGRREGPHVCPRDAEQCSPVKHMGGTIPSSATRGMGDLSQHPPLHKHSFGLCLPMQGM